MSDLFVDTSALVKRYIPETGSSWVRSWISPGTSNNIIIASITVVEFTSVVMRREREGLIRVTERRDYLSDFLLHVQQEYIVIDINDSTLTDTRNLLIRQPLRSLDALQLACALRSKRAFASSVEFISADTRLLSAAAAEGLPTDNPNLHP
ncbi:MAG: type II toxin-antitoxin system VapC family toxin [Anaerolineae bacterium]|nr:type II toxin-antitoxin system VapC family toxin [Anaerolineae bacterium]